MRLELMNSNSDLKRNTPQTKDEENPIKLRIYKYMFITQANGQTIHIMDYQDQKPTQTGENSKIYEYYRTQHGIWFNF